MRKIFKWLCEHKDEPSFKYMDIIIVLIILAIGVQIFDNVRTEWEAKEAVESVILENVPEEDESEKENAVIEFLDNSKLHIVLFGVTGITLAYAEHHNKHKIKESK